MENQMNRHQVHGWLAMWITGKSHGWINVPVVCNALAARGNWLLCCSVRVKEEKQEEEQSRKVWH